jgi:hypothetical protein
MKKSKIAIFLAVIIALTALLAGCHDNVGGKSVGGRRFVNTGDSYMLAGDHRYHVYYDTNTKIVYAVSDSHGGITPLYNTDGIPMTIDEYNAMR